MPKQRSIQQNRSLYKYFDLLSATLNANNFDVQIVLSPNTEWSAEGVKLLLWKPVMQAVTGRSSTAKLTTTELTEIYDIINKALGERLGLSVPFPSIEELILQEQMKDK